MNIGGYRLIKRIGAGGMSTVFEAEDGAGVRVALKLLNPALVVDDSGRERFRREVAMLQKVRGRYVAEVLDAETDADDAFIVTELIDGPTLEQDVVDSGVFEGNDLAELAERLREAVDAIHSAGVLHRDLKPSNVMLGPDGPVLIDFGIAQVDEDSRLTVPGSVAHTPGYCDPRVIDGGNPDEAADWWALAAVLAFAATGRAPFGKGNPQSIMRRMFEGVPDVVGLQGPLASAFIRALAPEIEDRIDIDQLISVLRTGRFDEAASGPGGGALAGIAGVMGGVGAGAADDILGNGSQGPDGATEVLNGRFAGDGATDALQAAPGTFGDGGAHHDAQSSLYGSDEGYGPLAGDIGRGVYGADEGYGYDENRSIGVDDGLGYDEDYGLGEGPETALRMRRAQLGSTEILDGARELGGGRTEILPTGGSDVDFDGGRTEILSASAGGVGADGGGRTEILPAAGQSAGVGGGRTEILPAAGQGAGVGDGRTEILPGGLGSGTGGAVGTDSQTTPPTQVLRTESPLHMPPSVPTAPRSNEPGLQAADPTQGTFPGEQGMQQPAGPPRPPAWNEFLNGPGQSNDMPAWMRQAPTARLIVFLAGLAILSLGVRFPIVGVCLYGFVAFTLGVIGSSHTSLNHRRSVRGGKFSGEMWGVALRMPLIFLKVFIEQAVSIAVGLALGTAALWGLSIAVPEEPRLGTLAAVGITMVVAWFNALSASARLGARDLLAAITPELSYKYFWGVVLILLTGLGVLYSSARAYPDWTPLPKQPFFLDAE